MTSINLSTLRGVFPSHSRIPNRQHIVALRLRNIEEEMGKLSGVKTLLLWTTTPPIPYLTAPHMWGIRPIQALASIYSKCYVFMLEYILAKP